MRALILLLIVAVMGCSTYRDHLNRGQRLYQENEYESALAIWRVLEADMDALTWEEQARYAYLRGMTDYRLGFRRDARHWLAIAKAINKEHPGGLAGDWSERTEVALDELNREVFGQSHMGSDSEALEHGSGSGEASEQTPGDAEEKKTGRCQSEADCGADEVCISGKCFGN